MNKMLIDAIHLADKYFKDKVDKGGHPYMNHLTSVMCSCVTEEGKIVGVLHDIIEDTDISISELESVIHENLIEAIQIVSRKPNETYNEFIQRIVDSKNLIAIEVKLADLENNMDLSRLNEVKQKDIDRVKKYQKAWDKLSKVYLENVQILEDVYSKQRLNKLEVITNKLGFLIYDKDGNFKGYDAIRKEFNKIK